MARSRRMPPLFEVMRETGKPTASPDGGNAAPYRPVAPRPQPQPAPSPAPAFQPRLASTVEVPAPSPAPASPAPSPPADPGSSPLAGRTLQVPMQTMLIVGAAVLTVIILVWTLAYRTGERGAAKDLASKVGADVPPGDFSGAIPHDPLTSALEAGRGAGGDGSKRSAGVGGGKRAKDGPVPTPVQTSADPGVDPRVAETNYLAVVHVNRFEDAVTAADYLSRHGVPAGVVPRIGTLGKVDRAALAAKNGPNWKVIVLEGITSADYKRGSGRRTEIEAKVAKVGREWVRDDKTGIEFKGATWEKYSPSPTPPAGQAGGSKEKS